MNARGCKFVLVFLPALVVFQAAFAGPASLATDQGNRLYEQGKFDEAIKQYDQALVGSPRALEPKFNQANSYYRLDDLEQATNLYRQVASESKDMKLVTRAKYNLGNCSFQQGSKQRDSNVQKAIEEMKSAIGYWRGVLDIDPENQKAAKNIEVARLTIKDILDQIKNQQDPNQPQDPNQGQQNQQDPNQPQDSGQQQSQDPNQPQDPNQQQQQGSGDDPNEPGQQEQQQIQEKNEEQQQADATAQEILDKEQRDKKQRQTLQRSRYQRVEKDW